MLGAVLFRELYRALEWAYSVYPEGEDAVDQRLGGPSFVGSVRVPGVY